MTDEELFIYIKEKADYNEVGLDFDYKVELKEDLKEINVYLKGSDSDIDWKLNFTFIPVKVKFGDIKFYAHSGHYMAYLSGRNRILKEIEEFRNLYPDFSLNIYGWSLGSGILKIMFIDLYSLGYKITKYITFGDVKTLYTNPKRIKIVLPEEIKEYICENDFITWLVPGAFRFKKFRVGPKFNIKEIFNTDWYHHNYDKLI